MGQEYFICSIASYEGHRGNPLESREALDQCKKENAYFIKDNAKYAGLLKEVLPDCVILLSYNQYVVAYGKVKRKAYIDSNNKILNSPYRIDVEKWNWINSENYEKGYDTKTNLLRNTLAGSRNDKIKKIKSFFASEAINMIDRTNPFKKNDGSHNSWKGIKNGKRYKPREIKVTDLDEKFLKDDDYNYRVYNANPEDKENPTEDKCVIINGIYRIIRNATAGKRVLVEADYKCAFCNVNETFITKKGVQYMEAHHLIPCNPEVYKSFIVDNIDIDVESNIMCLCPTCHRRIHFGSDDERKLMIKSLYEMQKEKLHGAGIEISIDELYKKYNV